jgi:hypothetical protein
MPIKKLFTLTIITFLIASCKKDEPLLDESLQISFKLDGKEYSKVLGSNQMNAFQSVSSDRGQGDYSETRGVIFQLGDSLEIGFSLGYINRKANDADFSYQSIKQALYIGSREYKCLACDTSIRNGVDIILSYPKKQEDWSSYKFTNNGSLPITNEQNGSSFTITEVKETKVKNYGSGFIVKGTFNCNLFKNFTLDKSVLTDGKFTIFLISY